MSENMLLNYLLKLRGDRQGQIRRPVTMSSSAPVGGAEFYIEPEGFIPEEGRPVINPSMLTVGGEDEAGMAENAARAALKRRMELQQIDRLLFGE